MDTSPPNNEAPATGKSRVSSKTSLNNNAEIVLEVPRERKCKTVVVGHETSKFRGKIAENRDARILVTKDSPPLIDGRFPAVERADFSGHTLDADRRDHGFEACYARAVRGGRSYRKRKSRKGRFTLLGMYLRPERLFFLCRCKDVHSVPATSSCAIRCPNNQKEYAVKLAASEAEKQTILMALNRWSGGTGIVWSSGAEVL